MTETVATVEGTHGVTLTDAAVSKVKALLSQENRDDLRLRIAVQPGGCSGLIYQLYFDERVLEGDAIVEFGDSLAIVDFLSQLERTGNLAEIALGAQYALTFLGLLLLFYFGTDRNLISIDDDMNIFFLDARKVGMDQIAVSLFLDVHFYGWRLGRGAVKIHWAYEKAAEQVIEWVDSGDVCHGFLLSE